MKSNVTVGPPIDLLAYETDQLSITHQRRFLADDSDLMKIGQRWQQALRVAVAKLPNIRFTVSSRTTEKAPAQESIQLVETPAAEAVADTQAQQEAPPAARVTKPPGED
jgi:hypothetical protein